MLNERSQTLLKTLIERYIAEGQPVGSRTLAELSRLELSPASIRNVLADLEGMGLVASPHTSAGRVPTARGYRVFVDTLLSINPLPDPEVQRIARGLVPDSPQRLVQTASQLLSDLTSFAGVVVTPERADVAFRQIEFLRLGERRVLLILVTLDGNVQNHLIHCAREYPREVLDEAARLLNSHYAGLGLSGVVQRLEGELHQLRGDIAELMAAALRLGQEAVDEGREEVLITGENRLLQVHELSDDLERLRGLFATFERRTELLKLLRESRGGQGVKLFIGEESGVLTLDECSVVTAPYEINGLPVGTLGVVGPTRMDYRRVIPIVDLTARLLSAALSYKE